MTPEKHIELLSEIVQLQRKLIAELEQKAAHGTLLNGLPLTFPLWKPETQPYSLGNPLGVGCAGGCQYPQMWTWGGTTPPNCLKCGRPAYKVEVTSGSSASADIPGLLVQGSVGGTVGTVAASSSTPDHLVPVGHLCRVP